MKRSRRSAGLQRLKGLIPRAALKVSSLKAARQRSKEIFDLSKSIQGSVAELVRHANDDDQFAAVTLANITCNAVAELNGIARQRPKMFLAISRTVFAWPAFVSPKRGIMQRSKTLLKLLEVGKAGMFSDRKWQIAAPTTGIAMNMFFLAAKEAAAGRLPRLTPTTKRQWFNKSWDLFLWADWKPEEDPRVASLGKSKATKKPKYCKTLHAPTQRANMRAAIKAKLWKTFDAVVAAK